MFCKPNSISALLEVAHWTPVYKIRFKAFQVERTAYAKTLRQERAYWFKELEGGQYVQS